MVRCRFVDEWSCEERGMFRAPDSATIKRKMLCASSKDALKNALQGIRNHLQATCKSDLDLNAIISEKTKSK